MSWKKYGGTNKLDKMNTISVNHLSADSMSLQTPYVGIFSVNGDIYVSNDIIANRNVEINNDLFVLGNIIKTDLLTVIKLWNII